MKMEFAADIPSMEAMDTMSSMQAMQTMQGIRDIQVIQAIQSIQGIQGMPHQMMSAFNAMPPAGVNVLAPSKQAYSFPYTGEPQYLIPQMGEPQPNAAQHQQHQHMSPSLPQQPLRQTESKPRLAKDEVDLLEGEFQKNSKPTTQRKREIASILKVDNPRINNWFQNRRAKAKQMLRRGLDTRVSADGSPSESSPSDTPEDSGVTTGEFYGTSSQSRPTLQASSAAFPSSEDASSLSMFSLHASSAVSAAVNSTPSCAEEYPSPKSMLLPHTATTSATAVTAVSAAAPPTSLASYAPVMNSSSFLTSQPPRTNAFYAQAQLSPPHPTSMDNNSDQTASHHTFEQPFTSFAPFSTGMGMESVVAPVPGFPDMLGSVEDVPQLTDGSSSSSIMTSCDMSIKSEALSPAMVQPFSSPISSNSPASAISDLRFKSPPPPANIASRRNKGVPAMLDPLALRNYSYGPKTGIDVGGSKRIDAPAPIRRIASATGIKPNRVQKQVIGSAPRSPLNFERNKEAWLQSLQAATGSGSSATSGCLPMSQCSISNNVSPITPREAILSSAEATVAPSSDDDFQCSLGAPVQHPFFVMDSTIKTPPGTPGYNGMGLVDSQIGTEIAWGYMPGDDALITPSLGSFGSEEFSMPPVAPAYVANSQPPTPSLGQGMAGYFPMRLPVAGMGQAEYTFPGESYALSGSLDKASPSRPKGKQFQFTPNVTPQSFFSADK